MFAVPGWAVSASSLVQEQPHSKHAGGKKSENIVASSSKKRKRNIAASDSATGEAKLGREPTHTIPQSDLHTGNSRDGSTLPKSDASKRTKVRRKTESPPPNDIVRNAQSRSEQKGLNNDDQERSQSRKARRVGKTGVKSQSSHEMPATKPMSPAEPTMELTPLQAKMRSKLTSARFRHLNETLYTTTSSEALKLFSTSPELFADYHAGFAQQVKDSWPQNPVDIYVKAVKSRGALSDPRQGIQPLPRRKTGSCTIADLGCGDAPLARGCQANIKTLKLKFHNYDLHAANTFVTKADMSNLPLRDGEADIAVFCLSLMGTNWINFVEEAWRILRGDGRGEVWVAEVKSRFGRITKGRVVENSVGKRRKKPKTLKENGEDDYDGPEQFAEDERAPEDADDETDISAFIKVFTRRGFQLRDGSVDKRNKMFVSMIFTKSGIPTAGKHKGLKWTGREYQKQHEGKPGYASGRNNNEEITPELEARVLKPCVYKTR